MYTRVYSTKEVINAFFSLIVGFTNSFLFSGDLDLDSMRTAGALLVGSHDFRNFCKMDVGNGVVEFIRRLDAVYVEELAAHDEFASPTLNRSGLKVCDCFGRLDIPLSCSQIASVFCNVLIPLSFRFPQLCQLRVVGSGFLWHQIRCIVAVLFLIAQGKEELEVK